MEIVFLLLPLTLILVLIALFAFFWANKKGQFGDTKTPALKILFDDESSENSNKKN